jgi:hypothetical protein
MKLNRVLPPDVHPENVPLSMVLSGFLLFRKIEGQTSYYSPWLSWALCAMEAKVHIQVDICFSADPPDAVRQPCHGFGSRDQLVKPFPAANHG